MNVLVPVNVNAPDKRGVLPRVRSRARLRARSRGGTERFCLGSLGVLPSVPTTFDYLLPSVTIRSHGLLRPTCRSMFEDSGLMRVFEV